MNEVDPFTCPDCGSSLAERYRVLAEVVCPTCGQQVCNTGIYVAGVSAPGYPPAKVQLHAPYWLPVPPVPGQLPDKTDQRTDKKKSRDPRPRDLKRLKDQWREFNKIRRQRDTDRQAALEITENERDAETLLRQFRRYRHLLNGGK
jgi:hypothetical protein